MRISLFVICCCFAGTLAWLPPERCRQGKRRRAAGGKVNAPISKLTTGEIQTIQQANIEKEYKKYSFTGVPIRGSCEVDTIELYSSFDCKFHTHSPSLITSSGCTSSDCKLIHTVTTEDTYTSDEGYNWGVSVSSQVSLGKIFEVGAEASTGGSYSCSYTKGKTVTDTIECGVSAASGYISLYYVRSDLLCDFGTVRLVKEKRNSEYGAVSSNKDFTSTDITQIKENAAKFFDCRFKNNVMVDTGRISARLLQKLMKVFPKYDPYTDTLTLSTDVVVVNYYKVKERDNEYQKIVPFTTENGNGVYQFVCLYEKYKKP